MDDAFSRCHPILNFFYFAVVLVFTMFIQHPVFLLISFIGALCYGIRLQGFGKTLRTNFLLTLPGFFLAALLNPMFNHYGVTMLVYMEGSGNWITLEALACGFVLGAVLFIVIQWFSCYNQVMTSDKFIYLFGRIIPALSLILSMVLRFVPRFLAQLKIIRNGQKSMGRDVSNGGFLKKAKYGLQMLSILVTWALENAVETSDSMKSRGYGLQGRTAFSIYSFSKRDKCLGAVLAALFTVFAYGCYKGAAFAQYDPMILLAGFTVQGRTAPVECRAPLAFATFAAFGLFCFIPLFLDIAEEAAMKRGRSGAGKELGVTYRKIYEEMEREG